MSPSADAPLRLVGAHALLDLEALQLAGGGARQVFLPDFVIADALGRGELLRQPLDIEADDFFRVDDLAFLEHVEVRDDDGVQALGTRVARFGLQAHHADFLDVGRLEIVRLDFFRIDVLAVGENDEFLAPAGDEEIAAGIEVAEVAGVQPAVFDRFGGGVGTIPVALHDDGAADQDFAQRVGRPLQKVGDRGSSTSMVGRGGPTEPMTTCPGGLRKAQPRFRSGRRHSAGRCRNLEVAGITGSKREPPVMR